MPIKSEFHDAPVADQPYSERLHEILWEFNVKNPSRPVLVSAEDESVNVTYGDLYLNSVAIASFLETRNFGHGDVACLVLPNCWEYFAIFMGVTLQGGAISGASILFTDYELERQFNDSNCKVIFCSDTSLDRVLKAARRCPLTVVVVPAPKAPKKEYPFGVHTFEKVLKTQPNLYRKKINYNIEKDLLILPYSSGTTGSPKGVMLSHRNFGTMMNILIKHFNEQILPNIDSNWNWEKESLLLLLPFYHIYGFGVLNHGILHGAQNVIMSHFDPETYCKCIEKYKIRLVMLVPPILVFLAKHPIVSKYDLSSVEFVLSGAAPAGKDLCEEVMKRLPNIKYIVQGYGMTECGMASHFPVLTRDHFAAAGKLASNFEMKIVDLETRKEVPIGQRGEICVRGPTIMRGYLNKPEATAETIDKDGWLMTGDIGYMSEDGWLYVVDRLKELIKVKGLQVPPAELEDLLLSHPDVQDCAVIGISDAKNGEVPKAYVVKKNPKLSEKQIIDFVKERVAPYKQLLGGVEFIKEVPKSQAGKILRRFLRDMNTNKTAQPTVAKL